MSYNCDSVRYVSGQLRIERDKALDFIDEHAGQPPEDCFLWQVTRKSPELVAIERPAWSGSGSGDEALLVKALALTWGEAELLLCYEGGDSFAGLHVRDGVVTRLRVKFVLE